MIKEENNKTYFIYLALVCRLTREVDLAEKKIFVNILPVIKIKTVLNDALAVFSQISNITTKGLITNTV